ncbi:MAG TPA: helix-turn-helix domain-containing protein [Haliangiales bacterium]|nr:helix-turn-helix domain-containing protein [Haliangiales bacterium]
MEPTYKLEELARAADVSPRTVRYYVQRGLLPAPQFRGRDTAYTAEHLSRLKAIKKLQDQYLPLDAIQVELERRKPEEILDGAAAPRMKVLPPPAPLPPSRVEPSRSWTRFQLRDGVEIHVRDDVAASLGSLVSDLEKLFSQGGPYR